MKLFNKINNANKLFNKLNGTASLFNKLSSSPILNRLSNPNQETVKQNNLEKYRNN